MSFSSLGKGLIVAGVGLVLLGMIVTFLPIIPGVGRLPGDLYIKKENFSFYFPLTTCLLVSLLLTLIARFLSKK